MALTVVIARLAIKPALAMDFENMMQIVDIIVCTKIEMASGKRTKVNVMLKLGILRTR